MRRSRLVLLGALLVLLSGCQVVIAAGTSETNLPTESVWPGALRPPYVCCWNAQGGYVTFSFNVSGVTSLALRYSAGSGSASRRLLLDGTDWITNQRFPATADWSTWATLTLARTLGSGPHKLEVLFDQPSGSAGYMNLDTLTVSTGALAAPPVSVAVGYADGASGPSPWSGAPGTVFIGSAAACCLSHGPDNDKAGYDAGTIEVTNTTSVAHTVQAVTASFGGASSPSSFDLWGASASGGPALPVVLAPGQHLVLTMTVPFNFDTSDIDGEACNPNTGVVPVVHVTVDSSVTDFDDDHQILNSDGTDLAGCPGASSEAHAFTVLRPGRQPTAGPVDDVAPVVVGTPVEGRVLTGLPGAWTASPPPVLAMAWDRCDPTGGGCTAIPGATTQTYRPTATDVGSTLRFHVRATNPAGTAEQSTLPTSPIQSGPAISQLGSTDPGNTSILATDSTERSSDVTATRGGTTVDLTFFARGAGADQAFTPKLYAVNGATATLVAQGAPVTVPRGADATWYVSPLPATALTAGTTYRLALDPSGVFNGTYLGATAGGPLSCFVDLSP